MARTKHGALLDAQILAEVYVELLGGKQTSLGLAMTEVETVVVIGDGGEVVPVGPRQLRHRLSEAERTRHAAFIATLGGGGAVWRDYLGEEETA